MRHFILAISLEEKTKLRAKSLNAFLIGNSYSPLIIQSYIHGILTDEVAMRDASCEIFQN